MRKLSILILFVTAFSWAQTAVDTITYMQYNLLSYRTNNGNCTNSNNNATSKDGYMATIVGYVLPDIIAVNEMGADGGTAANRLLTNAINVDGRTNYKQCNYSANSNLCNMLYYNKNKFDLYAQDKIERAANGAFLVRQIDVYTLFYTNSSELTTGDTTFLAVYVTHLKAGSGSSDKTERAAMTAAAMKYHEDNYSDANYIFSGDFNIQTQSEDCYQNLINYSNNSVRFYDPKNKPGSWNSNSNYADLHTQSTRSSSSEGGCFSTGGLDDRFDFILCGKEIMDNARGINYISGSYKSVGNDALHFNKDIISSPANTSVPGPVLNALYYMSDHLPVTLQLGITRGTASTPNYTLQRQVMVGNPVNDILYWKVDGGFSGTVSITDLQGKQIYASEQLEETANWQTINTINLLPGTYIFTLESKEGTAVRKKVVKM